MYPSPLCSFSTPKTRSGASRRGGVAAVLKAWRTLSIVYGESSVEGSSVATFQKAVELEHVLEQKAELAAALAELEPARAAAAA